MPVRKSRVGVRSPGHCQELLRVVKALERIAEGQASQTQLVNGQLRELSALKKQGDLQFKLDGKLRRFEDDRKVKDDIRRTWDKEILRWDPELDWPEHEHRSLDEILISQRPWTNPEFRWAYPKTAEFLNAALSCEKSLSTIQYESFLPNGQLTSTWSCTTPHTVRGKNRKLMLADMWRHVKQHTFPVGADGQSRVASRLLCVTDISPIVAIILLASTPKYVLGVIHVLDKNIA
jgi:hypothetical protein